ncbi:MAG TPA: hypothetical protein VM406_03320 [Noviherbaspirillum sp.]|nr:hypothetical protein [Noviherbaspirillum sp.]
MLTATYSLVAIAAEQEKTRTMLNRLQQFLDAAWSGLQNVDFGFLESGYHRLLQFDQYLRERKIERFLIPVLRGTGREAELLIAEMESLRHKSIGYLREAGALLASRTDFGRLQVSRVCESMSAYCSQAASRLTLEEQSLLPLARRLLSVEDWFRLASDFLSRDSAPGRRSGRPNRGYAHPGARRDMH